jgi:predicted N-acyltransferase
MTGATPWRVRSVAAMAGIDPAVWNRLAAASEPAPVESVSQQAESLSQQPDSIPQKQQPNPFISHEFLSALEESDCVSATTGWAPAHQLVEAEDGSILGAAPCYVKSHSLGEYVFDHAWADALQRAGGRYYPKLQVAVPFTPVTGPRLLGSADSAVADALCQGLEALRERVDGSSIHVTFPTGAEAQALARHGYLTQSDWQYHWFNEGYASFADFLGSLASRKRKAIARERREALANGISIAWLTGAEIAEAHWDAFFAFYMDTGSRKWGRPYLNRRFFSLLGERMAGQIVLIMARRAGRLIAGAINFFGNGVLYGRNWGTIEQHPFLHFEVCYYQAMDFAIAHGLRVVEAGAQGEHKLARGYRAVATHSAHSIAHPGLHRAVAAHLLRAKEHSAEEKIVLDSMGPFRRT